MKKLASCALLAVLIALACCPCKQVPSEYQRQPKKRQFSHGYVPTSLDSLLLFNAWDGRSCLALDSFFQLWENQSRMAMAQEAPPDDTMKVVYELFEALFLQSSSSSSSKYAALQDSVTVIIVDSSAYAAVRSLSHISLSDFRTKDGRARQFRYPFNLGKPTLSGLPEFHKALSILFLEDDQRLFLDVKDVDWETVFAKSRLLEPYLQVQPNHWGFALLTCTDPIMPSVILDERLSKALVEFQSWGCGGTWEYTRQDTIWIKTGEIDFWIE